MRQFEGDNDKLFELAPLAETVLSLVAQFYQIPGKNNDKWFDEVRSDEADLWIGRLIPIPTGWAALFLDYPDLGTAFHRVTNLINSVAEETVGNIKILAWQMAYACQLMPDLEESTSALAMDWKRLLRSKHLLQWRSEAWNQFNDGSGGTDLDEEGEATTDDRKTPPEDPPPPDNDFWSVFEGGRRPCVLFPMHQPHQGVAPMAANTWGGSPYTNQVPRGHLGTHPPSTQPAINLGALLTTMLQAQADSQMAVTAANNANLIAFTTAMAQALASKGGVNKEANMTVAKKRILQACSGWGISPAFRTPPVYLKMEIIGSTTDVLGRILCCLLKPAPLTLHKSNICVTPHLVLMVKTLSFSPNGDKTYARCTRGITIFAGPWRTVEAMNEDAVEEEYYQASTLKLCADVRKHTAGLKVELPTDLLGLVWMFNNYCQLLDVLFGPNCLHFVRVRAIRDGLKMHENDLEPKITKTLCLHLLWQIHHDSRQFFLLCERWEPGEPLQHSSLAGAVNWLVEDCAIEMTLTCPVSSFMGPPPKAPMVATAGAWPTTAETQPGRAKPSINTAIPPNCKKMVNAFNAFIQPCHFLP